MRRPLPLFRAGLLVLTLAACTPATVVGGEGDGGRGDEGSGPSGSSASSAASSGSGAGGAPTHATSASATSAAASGTSGAGAGDATSGSASSGAGGSPCPSPVPAQPGCYWEEVCPSAPLDDVVSAYSSGDWLDAALTATERRYPSANCLFAQYAGDVGNYADTWSFAALAESMMTMMHEETHGFDYEHALWGDHFTFYARCDHAPEVPFVNDFPRSEILPLVSGSATDLYDGTYLTGTQGTYGWVELLDEWNAYVNGMAAIALVGDHVEAFGISGTDGALAFAYYVELYLRVARTDHPATYAELGASAATLDFLREEWNRMHFFLGLADVYPNLSIAADDIAALVYADENRSELELLLGPLQADACN